MFSRLMLVSLLALVTLSIPAAAEDTGDDESKIYITAMQELQGADALLQAASGDELALIEQEKLIAAHEKLLAAMAELRASGDLSEAGLAELEAVLEAIAHDLQESQLDGSAAGVFALAAPHGKPASAAEQEVYIQKQLQAADEAKRELEIMLENGDVKIKGEGFSDEELAEIERQFESGEGQIDVDGAKILKLTPEAKGDALGLLKLKELEQLEELHEGLGPDLGHKKLAELELKLKELPEHGLAAAGEMFVEQLGLTNEAQAHWDKEWQALLEELAPSLTPEQLEQLRDIVDRHPAAAGPLGDKLFLLQQLGGKQDLQDWQQGYDIFRKYAPGAAPFSLQFEQQLEGDLDEELAQVMGEIERLVKKLMLKYK